MKTHHKMINGDSRIMSETDDKSVQLVITSPPYWQLKDYGCSSNIASLKVSANVTLQRFELTEGFESRYYMEKTSLPILEIEVNKDAEVITEITLN